MLKREDLREYQKRAVDFVKRVLTAALFLDMGLGKTIIVLTAIVDFLVERKAKKFLVIGPIRVIETVWRQEAAKWEHTRNLKFSLVRGNQRVRDAALREAAHVYLVNPENVAWLIEWMKKHGCPFDGLVVDESSMFKSSSTQRWKALRLAITMFNIRMILTGTPTPNNLMELWPQVYLLDQGARLGTSFYRFRDRLFQGDYMGYHYTPRTGTEQYIYNLLADITIRLDAKDWLSLPPVVKNRIEVTLPDAMMKAYKKFEKEMFLSIEQAEHDVEAFNAAALTMRCEQLADGAIYRADEFGVKTEEFTTVHDAKLDALKEVIEEAGDNVLVAYHFGHDLKRLRAAFPKAPFIGGGQEETTETIKARWMARKEPILFVHPASAGHGLDGMQVGGRTVIFFYIPWSREQHDQLIARVGGARRAGSEEPTMTHYLVAAGTVDEAKMIALRDKGTGQRALLNALREYSGGYEDILS